MVQKSDLSYIYGLQWSSPVPQLVHVAALMMPNLSMEYRSPKLMKHYHTITVNHRFNNPVTSTDGQNTGLQRKKPGRKIT